MWVAIATILAVPISALGLIPPFVGMMTGGANNPSPPPASVQTGPATAQSAAPAVAALPRSSDSMDALNARMSRPAEPPSASLGTPVSGRDAPSARLREPAELFGQPADIPRWVFDRDPIALCGVSAVRAEAWLAAANVPQQKVTLRVTGQQPVPIAVGDKAHPITSTCSVVLKRVDVFAGRLRIEFEERAQADSSDVTPPARPTNPLLRDASAQ